MAPDVRTFQALQSYSKPVSDSGYIPRDDASEAERVEKMRDANGVGDDITYLDPEDIASYNLADLGINMDMR